MLTNKQKEEISDLIFMAIGNEHDNAAIDYTPNYAKAVESKVIEYIEKLLMLNKSERPKLELYENDFVKR